MMKLMLSKGFDAVFDTIGGAVFDTIYTAVDAVFDTTSEVFSDSVLDSC